MIKKTLKVEGTIKVTRSISASSTYQSIFGSRVGEIKSIDISKAKDLTVIDKGAFLGCTKLEKIVFSEGLKEIGTSVFANCSNLKLKESDFPKSLDKIVDGAFEGASSVIVPEDKVAKFPEEGVSQGEGIWVLDSYVINKYIHDDIEEIKERLDSVIGKEGIHPANWRFGKEGKRYRSIGGYDNFKGWERDITYKWEDRGDKIRTGPIHAFDEEYEYNDYFKEGDRLRFRDIDYEDIERTKIEEDYTFWYRWLK